MNKAKRYVSREIGIEVASICNKYFLKSTHLHYGYWPADLEVDITNLRTAQENYAKFIISHIPDGVRRILDVGCGTGQIAKMLVEAGYEVDCVSPSSYLSRQAQELLGETSRIFECRYEELEMEDRYDLILFCESFQYINPEEAIKKTLGFLNQGGYVLICDIFKKGVPGKSPLPGGHPLSRFYNTISEYPLESFKDLDITEQTAPTMDIENDVLNKVVKPTTVLGQQLLENRYPVMSKALKFLYRKKINKIDTKYFSGGRTGENFKKFKSYRLLLYRKKTHTSGVQPDFTDACLGSTGLRPLEKVEACAITDSADSRWLDRILHHLSAWRTLALVLTTGIIVIGNILSREKPHELSPLNGEISAMAITGVVLVLAGVFIRFWARGHFKRGHMLTTGPYAIVRHPLSLGSLLVVCGILFQLNYWMNWVIMLPLFAAFYGAGIIYEDRSLEKKYGEQWQSYKARIPAIIPSLKPGLLSKQARKWSWKVYLSTGESKITLALLSLPLLIELLIENLVFEGMLGIQ